jgi:hypothetical protein
MQSCVQNLYDALSKFIVSPIKLSLKIHFCQLSAPLSPTFFFPLQNKVLDGKNDVLFQSNLMVSQGTLKSQKKKTYLGYSSFRIELTQKSGHGTLCTEGFSIYPEIDLHIKNGLLPKY